MGAADRLHTPGSTYEVGPIAPTDVARGDKTGLYDTGVNPADTKSAIRPSADVVYDGSDLKDLRSLGANERGRVVFVNSDAAGADTFTLSFTCDVDNIPGYVAGTADTDGVFTTSALDDDASAATIQTAIRAALPGTDLTVVEGDGPDFYIIFDREFWPRRYPLVTFTGTGCTATITTPSDALQDARGAVLTAARDGEQNFLGESYQVGASDTILRPTIGTITVTPGTDQVDTFAFPAGVDGGTYELQFGASVSGNLAYNADGEVVKDAVRAMVAREPGYTTSDAPTVALVTPFILELDFGDWATGDDVTLSFDDGGGADAAPTALAFDDVDAGASAAARAALVKAHVVSIASLAALVDAEDIVVTENTENVDYSVRFTTATETAVVTAASYALADTGATPDATPDEEQALSLEGGFTFTYENGRLAGRPVGGANGPKVVIGNGSALTDGGVSESATLTVSTAGVKGSASAAYTENGSGDTVLAAAILDSTGESFGYVGDAASPIAFTGLIPGVYHAVLRSVEDGRVSKADSKAFTVTSA